MKKVIVVGLDGLESSIVERMLLHGDLPHLRTLRQAGGYSKIRTTYPAQTPVAWSTFSTGVNPGGHGIFDFIRRNPATYLPDLALNRYEQKNAYVAPKAVNLRRGKPLWNFLSEAGIPSVVLRMPCTYPPDALQGRMLAGMGVPDLRGGLGTSSFYSSSTDVKPGESENTIHLQVKGDEEIRTHIIGPRDPRTGSNIQHEVRLRVDANQKMVRVLCDGQPKILEVREGSWSDWLKIKFKTGFLQSVRGAVRFYLVRTGPVLELYASPVNFDPEAPAFPISHPSEYAKNLADAIGTYYTTGMVEDHNGLNNERFDETAYLRQCEEVIAERERMMLHELERFDRGFFFCLFDTPDRFQHMFWRFNEPNHPANAEPPNGEWGGAIEEQYRRYDQVIGKVLEQVDHDTLLIVLSDHGMNSFRRGVHLNSWLYDQGLLAFKDNHRPGHDCEEFFRNVDWDKTKAYALGLGGIYLNIKGREERGTVEPSDAGALSSSVSKALTGLGDPETGTVAIRSVSTRDQIYSGEFAADSPDLVVNCASGYRASWATTLGGVPEGHFEDNRKKWSGDHIIDPCLVPGVLFMNRPFRQDTAGLIDMAPTILAALGVHKGPAMEGSSLLI